MSRRKQAKPQHLKTDGDALESGLLWDSGVMESLKTDAPTDVCHSSEETHICDKCCAEFFTWTELSEHHKVCTEDPLVLIIKDNEGMPSPQESFIRFSTVPSIDSSESSAAESIDVGLQLRHRAVNDESIDHLEEGPDCEIMELELCPPNKQPLNCSPQSPDIAEPSSLLMSSAGMPTTNVTLEILHSTRVAVAQFSQGLNSSGIGGKATSDTIPMIMENLLALQQQQVHQLKLIEQICSQVTYMNKHSPQAGLYPVSSSLTVTNPFPSQGVIAPSIFPQSGTMSSTANEQTTFSFSSVLEKSQSPPVQFISGKHTFRDVTGTSVSSENVASPLSGRNSGSSKIDSQTNRTGCTQTLSISSPGSMEQSCILSLSPSMPFVPQSPLSNTISPNPLASIAATANTLHPLATLVKHRKRKLPNIALFKDKQSPEEPFFKHKCRFCAKVFGSDSALQIHLRSHTGERPFKCNICGNRFSTKGNLKVHFKRHKDKYPHVQMNPYPIPEYLDNVPTSSGIPYGMSISSDKNVFSWLDNKPVVSTLPAAMGLPLSSTFTSLGGLNDSVSVTSPIKLPYQPALFESPSLSPNHRGNEAVPVSPESSQKTEATDKTEGAFLPQNYSLRVNLVTNTPISSTQSLATTPEPFMLMSPLSCSSAQSLTSDKTEHPADYMQASETSKLQQPVENIDKNIRDPNQCIVCHRVLSCQSALKMHYRIHTGERPYKCKVCGRAFTTKGNLKAHIGIHRESPPVQVQHSCPVCQKKFTNAIVLQQHIRMHMIGQIPGATLVNGLQEINVSLTGRNVDRNLGSNSNDIDNISMDDEEEVEGMKEGINCNRPNFSTNISSMAALENQKKIVDTSISPSNASGIKPLTNGLNDSSQLNAKCNLSEKKVESYSEIPNMSEFYSSPYASMSPVQRNSESMMITSTDAHNRSDSNEPLVASVKKEQSEAPPSAAAAMSQDVTGIQARKMGVKEKALYSTAFQQSREQATAQKVPNLTTSSSTLGLGKTEVNGHIQGNKASKRNNPQFPVHVPPTYTSVMTLRLGPAPPRRTPKQHNCNVCGKNFSSASALQIHERTHTGEKPFVCSVCGRAFTTKGNLKVHMGTHMWNNAPSRRGRRLSVESPVALLGGESVKLGEMIQKDLAVRPMNVDPGFWNRYATAIASSLATKNNEISVIQSRGISQLHTLTTGMDRMSRTGGSINKAGIELGNNRHFSLLIKESKEIAIN